MGNPSAIKLVKAASRSSFRRSVATTVAPSRTNCSAEANPIPLAAPVTKTVFHSNRRLVFLLLYSKIAVRAGCGYVVDSCSAQIIKVSKADPHYSWLCFAHAIPRRTSRQQKQMDSKVVRYSVIALPSAGRCYHMMRVANELSTACGDR